MIKSATEVFNTSMNSLNETGKTIEVLLNEIETNIFNIINEAIAENKVMFETHIDLPIIDKVIGEFKDNLYYMLEKRFIDNGYRCQVTSVTTNIHRVYISWRNDINRNRDQGDYPYHK